jgi:hypothetical protein
MGHYNFKTQRRSSVNNQLVDLLQQTFELEVQIQLWNPRMPIRKKESNYVNNQFFHTTLSGIPHTLAVIKDNI